MFSSIFSAIIAGIASFIIPIVVVYLVISYLRQSLGQAKSVPPLDLVDAKKLDDMVAKQVEGFLGPLLSSKGYTEDQIQEILVRTSVQGKAFRR